LARSKPRHGKGRRPWRPKRKPPDRLIVPPEAETFTPDPAEAGARLDVYLKAKLKWRSREKVQELIAAREITAGGARVDRAYRVKAGEEIRIPLPPPPDDAYRIGEIPLDILYEDDQLIVLNKPPGLIVHPVGPHRFNTLINALHLRYRDLENADRDVVPKLAHRIDRGTSGALVACKTGRHDRGAPIVFENMDVRKEYLAIAEGAIADDSGMIDLPIGPGPGPNPKTSKRIVTDEGQPARTGYRVVERFGGFTLLELRLFTGRQHQIRVHLRAVGHPILCDSLYGERSELRLSDIREIGPGEEDVELLARQALHSWRIAFAHPSTGEEMTFEAPLPEDMRRTLEAMRKA